MPTQARTSQKYENHEVYSPAGELMFRTSLKRCKWYVDRGLATEITSPTDSTMKKEKGEEVSGVRSFQLLFEPKGKGHARGREGDAWFLEEKKDRCVICGFISAFDPKKSSDVESGESERLKENSNMSGEERKDDDHNEKEDTEIRDSGFQKTGKAENLNGIIFHHVVPFCYRKYMPEAIKSSNSHDIQPLCIKCNNAYQAPATNRMTEISERFGAPLLGIGMVTSEENAIKKKAACDVFNVRKMKVPKDRVLQVEGRMREVYELSEEDDITEEIIKAGMELPISWRSEEFKTHGQLVVEALGEERLPEFVVEWRRHFMETMKPRFLSEHWSVDNPVMHD